MSGAPEALPEIINEPMKTIGFGGVEKTFKGIHDHARLCGPQLQSSQVRKSNEFVRFFDIPDTPPPPHLPLERFAVLILKSTARRRNLFDVPSDGLHH